MSDDRFWNREELYEKVWTTPMRTIAQSYGISDVGLAKVCRKLKIPLPGRGYWARKEAGQKLVRTSLPTLKETIRILKPPHREREPRLEEYATDQERAQLEKVAQSGAELVLRRGSLSHPLIVQARPEKARLPLSIS
jgi:hypothetical protein